MSEVARPKPGGAAVSEAARANHGAEVRATKKPVETAPEPEGDQVTLSPEAEALINVDK